MEGSLIAGLGLALLMGLWTSIGWWQGAGRAGFVLAAGLTGFLVAGRWSAEIADELAPLVGWRIAMAEAVVVAALPLVCMVVLGLGGGAIVAPAGRHVLARILGAIIALGTLVMLTDPVVSSMLDALPNRQPLSQALRNSEWIDRVRSWSTDAPTVLVGAVALVVIPAVIWLPATRTRRRRIARREAALNVTPPPPAGSEPRVFGDAPPPSSRAPFAGRPQRPADGPTAPIWRPEPAPVTCPACGTAMAPTDRFCPRCGRLRSASPGGDR